jgi:hypothetical protein
MYVRSTTITSGRARSKTSQPGTFPSAYFASDSISASPQGIALFGSHLGLARPNDGQLLNVDALHDELFPDDPQGYNIAATELEFGENVLRDENA